MLMASRRSPGIILARAPAEPGWTVLATTPCAVSIQATPSVGGGWNCAGLIWKRTRCEKFSAPAVINRAAVISSNHVRPVSTEPFIYLLGAIQPRRTQQH